MSLSLVSVPKLIHAFPHSPIIAVFVCCHITSYLSTFCQLHVHTIRLLPIFHKYQTNPIDPHCSWLHSGKLVCLQDISQPLVSWQKSYAHSGIVSRKNDQHQKSFQWLQILPIHMSPSSHIPIWVRVKNRVWIAPRRSVLWIGSAYVRCLIRTLS